MPLTNKQLLERLRSPVWEEFLKMKVNLDEKYMPDPRYGLREIPGKKREWNVWRSIMNLRP